MESGDEDPKREPAYNEGNDEDAHLDENSSLAHPSRTKKTNIWETDMFIC